MKERIPRGFFPLGKLSFEKGLKENTEEKIMSEEMKEKMYRVTKHHIENILNDTNRLLKFMEVSKMQSIDAAIWYLLLALENLEKNMDSQ